MATGIGVDFSPRWQASAPIPSGTEYGWIKVADGGLPYRTVAPDAMVARFKARKIPLGGYSYAQPGDGGLHARVLLAECRRLQTLDLVPVTDIESDPQIHTWSSSEAISYGRAFCRQVLADNIRPGVYMNASMAKACRPDQWPENPVIWIARYGAKPEAPGSSQYLGRYDVHQFSSTPVDQNQRYTDALFTASGGGGNLEGDDVAWTEQDFNVPLFTDNPDTPDERTIRFRDFMLELREKVATIEDKVETLGTPAALDYGKLAKALLAELSNPTP